jgi:hypothetical protein
METWVFSEVKIIFPVISISYRDCGLMIDTSVRGGYDENAQ